MVVSQLPSDTPRQPVPGQLDSEPQANSPASSSSSLLGTVGIFKDLFPSLSIFLFHAFLLERLYISLAAISHSRYPLAMLGNIHAQLKPSYFPKPHVPPSASWLTWWKLRALVPPSPSLPLLQPCPDYPWLSFSIPSLPMQPGCPPFPRKSSLRGDRQQPVFK